MTTPRQLCEQLDLIYLCGPGDQPLTGGVYCCDLLSLVMGRAPAQGVWVTVMGNVNAVAVAVLADLGCVVLAEGMTLPPEARQKAEAQGVTVLAAPAPVFDTARRIAELLEKQA